MSWAHYLLQVNIYLAIFYCFYKLLLANETYFVWNRIYLMSAGIFSLTIPFLRFEWFSKKAVSDQLYQGVNELNNLVTNYAVVPQTQEQYDWGKLLVIVYLLGFMFFLGRLVYQLFAIDQLFFHKTHNAAFSFFRRKSVSDELPEPATIHLHEDVHVKQLHTVDVLFFELLGIVTWFNPFIYRYKTAIKNIHEYLADEAAAKFQGDKEVYSLLLLSHAFGVKPNHLTNGFFTKSMIKKRIFMLHKPRSKRTAILKYGLFVPLFLLTLILSSASIRKNDQLLAVTENIPLNEAKSVVAAAVESPLAVINLEEKTIRERKESKTMITSIPETSALKSESTEENKAAWNSFYKHLGETIKYPTSAVQTQLQGNSVVSFTVKNEAIADLTIETELGSGCDAEVVKSIKSYAGAFPSDGDYRLKTTFKLDGLIGAMKNGDVESAGNIGEIVITAYVPKEDENTVYSFVSMENPPTYPGGIEKFFAYLGSSIKYPQLALKNGIQGNVFVSFVVEKNGELNDVKVERKLGYGTDEEALRVLKMSKRWNPGMLNGQPIRVRYNIPIRFKLAPEKTEIRKSIAIKGTSGLTTNGKEPLYVLDEKILTESEIATIKPDEIERINVLKGVLAINLYGSKAKHGAVLITTKKKNGQITEVNYN